MDTFWQQRSGIRAHLFNSKKEKILLQQRTQNDLLRQYFFMEGLYVQFHVSVFYPAFFPHEFGDAKGQYAGQYKVHQNNLQQHDRWRHGLGHGLKGHNLSYQTGAAHTGSGGVAGHAQQHSGDRPQDSTGDNGRQPDNWFAHNIADLQHTGAQPLGQQTADFIFPIAGYRKPHHVAAAAYYSSASGNSV